MYHSLQVGLMATSVGVLADTTEQTQRLKMKVGMFQVWRWVMA